MGTGENVGFNEWLHEHNSKGRSNGGVGYLAPVETLAGFGYRRFHALRSLSEANPSSSSKFTVLVYCKVQSTIFILYSRVLLYGKTQSFKVLLSVVHVTGYPYI